MGDPEDVGASGRCTQVSILGRPLGWQKGAQTWGVQVGAADGGALGRCLGCVCVCGVFLTTRELFFSWCHEKHFGDYLLDKNDSQLLLCVSFIFHQSAVSSHPH